VRIPTVKEESAPPINLSEHTRVRLPMLMLVAILASVGSAAAVMATHWAALAEHTVKLTEHHIRLQKLEESQMGILVMKNDVEWIRRHIEKERSQ
jgi:hypothetical protein